MERDEFNQMMDEIIVDENLPGSTPQNPKKHVRTLFINAFENTTNPQMRFRWHEAIDPGKFRLCDPAYWKASKDAFNKSDRSYKKVDVDAELESIRTQIER